MGEIPKLGLTEVVMSLEPAGPFVYMKSISRMASSTIFLLLPFTNSLNLISENCCPLILEDILSQYKEL